MQIAALCAFLCVLTQLSGAQTLSVCDVLTRLSELNGKEIQVRGAWFSGDTGSILWASPPCEHPVVRDGWVWRHSIAIGPDNAHVDFNTYEQKKELENRPFTMVMVTVTGVIRTKDHFKINPNSHLPVGFGEFVAGMVFSKAENLERVPFKAPERRRYSEECISPSPTKLRSKSRR